MYAFVGELVVFDNDETCEEEVQSKVDSCEMRDGALSLLRRGMGWLEDED